MYDEFPTHFLFHNRLHCMQLTGIYKEMCVWGGSKSLSPYPNLWQNILNNL